MSAQTLIDLEKECSNRETDFIDVDMPFSMRELEEAVSARFVKQLTRSDMPIVSTFRIPSSIATDKRRSRASLPTDHVFDPIDVDIPFSAAEVTALTSPAYVSSLGRSDIPVVRR